MTVESLGKGYVPVPVTRGDFKIVSEWEVDTDSQGLKWLDSEEPMWIIDKSTERKYWNEDKALIRLKCFFLIIITPLHVIPILVNIAWRILKLVTLSHFWFPLKGEYNLQERTIAARNDLARLFVSVVPISLISLELAAIYGLFRPHDGRKLYASVERATYETFIFGPCFQPNPTGHLFLGHPLRKNGF